MPTSPLASPGATRAVLAEHGLATKKRLGQHFLIDDNIVERIVGLASLADDEIVVEVGPGIGTLTVALCARSRAVVAVERDDELLAVLARTTSECANLAVVHGDAVSVAAGEMVEPFGPPGALVANLPYAVAATVVLRFFQLLESLRFAVVMVQAEVAARMAAAPRTKDYGAYTVKLQLIARPAGRFPVARTCFLPPPRVDSTVIRLERRVPALASADLDDAFAAADAAFAQRRKTIRNSIRGALGAPAAPVEAALDAAKMDGSARAETFSPETYVVLGAALRAAELLPQRLSRVSLDS